MKAQNEEVLIFIKAKLTRITGIQLGRAAKLRISTALAIHIHIYHRRAIVHRTSSLLVRWLRILEGIAWVHWRRKAGSARHGGQSKSGGLVEGKCEQSCMLD